MTLLPASAEPAANAGTGPEGHKRSASVESGASSDATMVASDIDWIDGADMGAVEGCHKLVAIEEALTSPPERAACNEDLAVHDAKRGRVSTDTASGALALETTTTTAGSPTTAAPKVVSINTATALAVADPNVDALNEPNEAQDAGDYEAAAAQSASAAAACDAAAAAMATSAEPDAVIAPGAPAPGSSAIVGLSLVDHGGPAQAKASATAGVAGALGSAPSASATIDANPTSRGDAGCPETPVVSRRSPVVVGAVTIKAFSIGRTSTPAPAPSATLAALLASATAPHGSGAIACLATVSHSGLALPASAADAEKLNTLDTGSKSAVIVANATSRVHANCPRTPVVSRQAAPRPHAIAGAAVNAGQYSAFYIGRRSIASSTAVPAVPPATAMATAAANPPAPAPTPALPPMLATTLSPMQPPTSPARFSVLRTVSRVIQRGMGAIRDALIALYTDGIGLTNGERSTLPGRPDEDVCGDGDAPIDAALLELRKRQRRRFLLLWRAQ